MPHKHVQNPSALDLLWRRKATSSKPTKRHDPFKMALVVEGGGMRGCVSAGMTAALVRLGYGDCFDMMIGTSAGAINLAYVAASQAVADAAPMYATDLASGRFISTWRAIHGKKPIMDLDYLFEDMMENIHPLDVDIIRKRGIRLGFTATIMETGDPILLTDFRTRRSLKKALRASAMIPGVGGPKPVKFRRMNLIDGGFSAFLPENMAREQGATHIFLLTNLPAGQFHNPPDYNHVRVVGSALSRLSSPVAETFVSNNERDNLHLERVRAGEDPTVAHCEMPEGAPRIQTLCKKPKKLWMAMEQGFKAMCAYMSHPDEPLPRHWKNLKNAKKNSKKHR